MFLGSFVVVCMRCTSSVSRDENLSLLKKTNCLPSGREYQKNDPAVTVDYNTADPVVRWDSYENFNQRYQDSLEGNALLFSSKCPTTHFQMFILHP